MEFLAKRILFVDGDEKSGREFETALRELNYNLVHVSSFEEASPILTHEHLDLILAFTDGPAKGFELTELARKQIKTKKTPVVLLSLAKDAEQKFSTHKARPNRANAYVKLPVPTEDVVDWIEQMIGLPAAPQERVDTFKTQFPSLHEKSGAQFNPPNKDMDVLLNELQEELEKERGEKMQFKDELTLLKSNLAEKDRELLKRDKLFEDLKKDSQTAQNELIGLRSVFEEAEQKHKRAQNALREYYRSKIELPEKLENKVASLESELAELVQVKDASKAQLESLMGQNRHLQEMLGKEKEKVKQLKELLESATRLLQ